MSARARYPHRRCRTEMSTRVRHKVLLHGEQSDSAVAVVEQPMPAGAPGPPLQAHAYLGTPRSPAIAR
jgi:hypothetical protein